MASWLLIVILSSIYLVLFVALSTAIVIVASNRIQKLKNEARQCQKQVKHSQELLDAYGIKEINIERESDY